MQSIEAVFTIAMIRQQPKWLSADSWLKMWGDVAREYYTQWSQSDRESQIYDITYMCNLKNYTNQPVYRTETCSQRKRTLLPKPEVTGYNHEINRFTYT